MHMKDIDISRRSLVKGASAFAALLPVSGLLAGCNAGTDSNADTADTSVAGPAESAPASTPVAGGSVLVAYYSAQGHTQAVAEAAADELGADLFVITPVQPYTEDDLDYRDEASRVSREHEDEGLRQVEITQVTPDGFDGYDTVLIGYPIWWGIAAWPVNAFVGGNDFTGKTVVPFCTSASSGLGQSGDLLAQSAGTGDWAEGMRFSSNVPEQDVRDWAASLM